MSREYQRPKAPRILITNAKGGSGKTTLATNLAAHYAQHLDVTIMDFDSQLSSSTWQALRPEGLNKVNIYEGFKPNQLNQTRSWQLHHSMAGDLIILDTPAAMPMNALEEVIGCADIIVIPVLPSMIDIKAVERFIYHLLQTRAYRKNPIPIGIIANRVRRNTNIFKTLTAFLNSLSLPVISVLRDTQQFIKAFEQGLGISELPRKSPTDSRSMHLITKWIDQQLALNQHNKINDNASDQANITEISVFMSERNDVEKDVSDNEKPLNTSPDEAKASL